MKTLNSLIVLCVLMSSLPSQANFITFDMTGKIARDLRDLKAQEAAKLFAQMAKQQAKQQAKEQIASGRSTKVLQWGSEVLGFFGVREAAKQIIVRAAPVVGSVAATAAPVLALILAKNHDVTPTQIAQWRLPYDEYFDRLWDNYAQDKTWVDSTQQTLQEASAVLNAELKRKFSFPIAFDIDSKYVFLSQTPSSQTYQVTYSGNYCANQRSCTKRYFELNADLFVTPQPRDMAIAHLATLSFGLFDRTTQVKIAAELEKSGGFKYRRSRFSSYGF